MNIPFSQPARASQRAAHAWLALCAAAVNVRKTRSATVSEQSRSRFKERTFIGTNGGGGGAASIRSRNLSEIYAVFASGPNVDVGGDLILAKLNAATGAEDASWRKPIALAAVSGDIHPKMQTLLAAEPGASVKTAHCGPAA